ncbi:histidinol-phosphatase HisJ family protein [Kitasatospora sp. NPDC127116]|uniref:histidinol-phosphatase HisJ family protein n=1 Tax=Kitasatospora sp. NPDC127116 TaxID=3345367 RepID=UPI003637A329
MDSNEQQIVPDRRLLPADNHVHTEWSWDASTAVMEQACERALAIGLPAIAFTDHADFTAWAFPGQQAETPVVRVIDTHARSGLLDVDGYWECLEHCRARFPDLKILAGVELGEPHLFAAETSSLVQRRDFQRVLGSLHSLEVDGQLHYAPTVFTADTAMETMRTYLAETLRMVESSSIFGILAHIDYPMRAWPKTAKPFDSADYQEEYRAVLRALASSGRALEVNTGGPWPADNVLRWWREEGGEAVSFGSDSHEPSTVGQNFALAAAMVESVGFRPGKHPIDFWRR